VHDLFARQMLRDRLPTAIASLAFMSGNLARARSVSRLRRLDRGECLGLVEQHPLIEGDLRGAFLRGASEVLLLEPAHFLLQQQHPLAQVFVLWLNRPQALVLFPQPPIQLVRNLQARGKFGVLRQD
jgi:hypothetical protein